MKRVLTSRICGVCGSHFLKAFAILADSKSSVVHRRRTGRAFRLDAALRISRGSPMARPGSWPISVERERSFAIAGMQRDGKSIPSAIRSKSWLLAMMNRTDYGS